MGEVCRFCISSFPVQTPTFISLFPRRGGLAESFSRRFSQNNTDQKLWEEQVTRSFVDGKRIKAEVRLKTRSILYRSPVHTPNKPHAPPVTLARCVVIDSQVAEIQSGELTVLFRHSAHGSGQREFQIEEGVEVCVWRPWHTLSTSVADVEGIHDTEHGPSDGPVWMITRFYVPRERHAGD